MTVAALERLPENIPYPGEEMLEGLLVEDIVLTPEDKTRGLTREQIEEIDIVPSYVLRAYSYLHNCEVAMKAYVADDAREKLEQEATLQQIARELGGTAVVPVLGVKEVKGTLYLLTEWQSEGSLHEKHVTGDNIAEVLYDAASVAKAIGAYNDAGYIHGDVSSNNILNGKLADYGAARPIKGEYYSKTRPTDNTNLVILHDNLPTGFVNQATPDGVIVARPGSLPPEITMEGERLNETVDRWGLAVALYDALKAEDAPQSPWGNFDTVAQLEAATEYAPTRLDQKLKDCVPHEVAVLMQRMLSPEKHNRPSAHEIVQILTASAESISPNN